MSDLLPENEFVTNDELVEFAEAMQTKYRIALNGRSFSIAASVKDKGVYVTVTLAKPDQSYVYPVEGRVMFGPEELTPREAAVFLIDYIDIYFEEFLIEEEEDIYLPIDWTDHQYDAIEFQVRGQILNKKLDAMADEWLRKADEAEGRV